ncbi:MAG: hypothetical protein ABSA67_03960 [Candidatus Brocadiia bacterium]|jgi:hypothetical protein
MDRERPGAAHDLRQASADDGHEHRAAIAGGPQEGAVSAMNAVLNGYREEAEIYLHVLQLTWRQRDVLRNGFDLSLFRDLLQEKEDLLRMAAQINSEMKNAKSLVLSYPATQWPERRELETVLDRLADTVEEVRIAEDKNACLLETAPSKN